MAYLVVKLWACAIFLLGYCTQIITNYLNLKFNHILNSVTLRFDFPFMHGL